MAVLEEWRDVVGYEGLYEVSSLGRVRNSRGLIMKQQKYHNGYIHLSMYRDGTKKNPAVHRLVWEAFNGPIPSGMQIDHVNTIRDDNRLSNLRCVTPKDNCKNPITAERKREANRRTAKDPQWLEKKREAGRRFAKDPQWRNNHREAMKKLTSSEQWRQKIRAARRARANAVLQIDKDTGEVIREWPCARDAERVLGISRGSVSACCRGKLKSAGGYRWCLVLESCS